MKYYLILLLFVSFCSIAQNNEKYIFFLHNKFLEENSLNSEHPKYGKAEYNSIINSFKKEGFIVISEKRKPRTNPKKYAIKVKSQIDSLKFSGIKSNDITVIGTSKGGYIAQFVSTFCNDNNLNFIFIGCFREVDLKIFPEINYCGNILNIYEKSDPYGNSCVLRKEKSVCGITNFKEIELNTNLNHGFLFKPLKEWIKPSIEWAKGNYSIEKKR